MAKLGIYGLAGVVVVQRQWNGNGGRYDGTHDPGVREALPAPSAAALAPSAAHCFFAGYDQRCRLCHGRGSVGVPDPESVTVLHGSDVIDAASQVGDSKLALVVSHCRTNEVSLSRGADFDFRYRSALGVYDLTVQYASVGQGYVGDFIVGLWRRFGG
jgi:hypothetical protein